MNRLPLSFEIRLLAALASLPLLTFAAGCGSKAAECAYLCERAATCTDQAEPIGCAASCGVYATTGGASARAAVSRCASCLAGASCAQIGGGRCDASCPIPALVLAEPGAGLPDAGAAASGSGSSAPLCEWRNDESARLVVRCRNERGELDQRCECFEEGVAADNFWSNDFCSVGPDAQRSRAARGCRWTL